MRNKLIQILTTLSLCATLVLSFGGCGNRGNSDSSSPNEETESSSLTSSTAEEEQTSSSDSEEKEEQPAESAGLRYELNGDGKSYTVKGIGSCKDTDLVIPESYNGLPVTAIGENAFGEYDNLTSVWIGESVTDIERYAFNLCTQLKSVTLGEGVERIGDGAFACRTLTEFHYNARACTDLISNNGVFSGAGADGDGLVVTVGANVEKIPAFLFNPANSTESKVSVTKLIFEAGSVCKSIGRYAFSCCDRLESVVIPEGVTLIGKHAFYACKALTEIRYNATECANLAADDEIFYKAGRNASGITLTVGKNVKKLPAYLFHFYDAKDDGSWTPNIEEVVFERGSVCESIGRYAFAYCKTLSKMLLPKSLISIGDAAFTGCLYVRTILYGGTAEEWSSISIGSYNFNLKNASYWYYSETEPPLMENGDYDGIYWYYTANGEIESWTPPKL